MSKRIILLLTLLISSLGFSQQSDQLELPNINPPSPESFKFTEYGKNGINEYSGKLNLNIPLYEYNAGLLKMPITLNYSGSGVKVEDISSWTGINWNLSVGGLITRQIKDAPDEGYVNRVMVNETDFKNNSAYLCTPNSQYYVGLARTDDSNDTEVDIFNFNFMGYSGSFYLDANYKPVYIENENALKIELVGNSLNNNQFIITTPDGIKCYFGGSEIETTRVISGAHNLNSDGVTSFFLYRIEHPINGTLILEYDTLSSKDQNINKSYDMTTQTDGQVSIIYTTQFIERKFVTRIAAPKRLRKIRSLDSKIEVLFERSDYDNKNFISVLNSIKVYNTDAPTSLLKKINFTYQAKVNPQSADNFLLASRFFLTQLEVNKDIDLTGNKYEKYIFEYDDPFGLPDRMSNSRDAVGYFNNKSNLSLIPLHPGPTFNNTNSFADLKPVFEYGKKGSLIKVVYPTKGYSRFEYEPVPAIEPMNNTYYFNINSYTLNPLEHPLVMTLPGYNAMQEDIPFPTITRDQFISFKINLSAAPHSNTSTMGGKGVEFIINDLTTNEVKIFTKTYPLQSTNSTLSHQLLAGHNYSFTLRFKDNYTTPTEYQSLACNLEFTAFTGFNTIDGLGIRLKRDKTYNYDNTPTNTKRYYYGTINGGYNDITKLKEQIYYPKVIYRPGSSYFASTAITTSTISMNFSSEVFNTLNKPFPDPEKFSTVSVSYGGDNFENGGTEKTFLDITDQFSYTNRVTCLDDGCFSAVSEVLCGPPRTLTVMPSLAIVRDYYLTYEKTNHTNYNGKLLNERTYVNKNGSLYKIQESLNEYDFVENENKKITNFVGRTIFNDNNNHYCNPQMTGEPKISLSSCYLGYYYTKVSSFNLKKTISTEYIDPIPMNLYTDFNENVNYNSKIIGELYPESYAPESNQPIIEAPFKKLITSQNFEYNSSLNGLATKIKTTKSEGSTESVVNTYVDKANTIVNLPNQNIYTLMKDRNIVSAPIQVEQYTNDTNLLSTKRTIYKQLSNRFLPDIIQTSKGQQTLEDRIIFEEYDNNGNITLVSMKNGSKVKYLYNANNQVIAKIENFIGTPNLNVNTITTDPCAFINSLPNSQVTLFMYDPISNLVTSTIDSKCQKTTYVYNELNSLIQIRDNSNNIVKTFDYNYKQ